MRDENCRICGEPTTPDEARGPDRIALFWSKVQETATCWYWIGTKSPKGYGRFFDGARTVQAHRFAYELVVGPIPKGLQLDHLCRVRACVNPAHLEPVTNKENVLRGKGQTAINAQKTHCRYGHPLEPQSHTTWRRCKTCNREQARARWRRDHEVDPAQFRKTP